MDWLLSGLLVVISLGIMWLTGLLLYRLFTAPVDAPELPDRGGE